MLSLSFCVDAMQCIQTSYKMRLLFSDMIKCRKEKKKLKESAFFSPIWRIWEDICFFSGTGHVSWKRALVSLTLLHTRVPSRLVMGLFAESWRVFAAG